MTPMERLPAAVSRYLGRFVARKRRLTLLKALGRAACFVPGWILLGCALDRFWPLPAAARLAWLALGSIGVVALLCPAIGLYLHRIDWGVVAAEIEARQPGFAQRLQTLISQLLALPQQRGSPAMLEQLAGEVADLAAADNPRRLIPWSVALRPWLGALALTTVAATLAPLPWLGLPTLVHRLVQPLAGLPPVTTTQLRIQPGNVDVPQGEALEIIAEVERLTDSRVQIYLRSDEADGQHAGSTAWSQFDMIAQAQGRYVFSLPAVERDRRYYVTAGDARSPSYTVRVQRKPGVTEFRIRYEYPAYTGRPPLTVTNTDGLIEAPAGTEVTLSVVSTEPLSAAYLAIGPDRASLATRQRTSMSASLDARVRQATFTVNRDQFYQVELVSDRQVKGAGPSIMPMRVLADRPPLARVVQPTDDLRLHPRDVLAVEYEALDDYGIGSLALVVQVNAGVKREFPLPLRGDVRRQLDRTALDLGALDVKLGDVVMFSIAASDRIDQKASSETRRVLVSPRSVDLDTQLRLTELRQAEPLARFLSDELETARQSLGDPRFLATFKIDQHIAAALEAAGVLRQRLLRVTLRSPSPAFSDAMAGLVDGSRVISNLSEEIQRVLSGNRDGNLVGDRLGRAASAARQLHQHLLVLGDGQQAAAILIDRANLAAAEAPPATSPATPPDRKPSPRDRPAAEARRQALDRARNGIRAAVAELHLDPGAADLEPQLLARVSAADNLIKSVSRLSFPDLARDWVKGLGGGSDWQQHLDGRLQSASQAEAVRPDADQVWARDLLLAAQSAERLLAMAQIPGATTQPTMAAILADYPSVLAAVQHEHDLKPSPAAVPPTVHSAAEAARRKLERWAAPPAPPVAQPAPPAAARPISALAMQANAQAQQGDFAAALRSDAAMNRALEDQQTAQPQAYPEAPWRDRNRRVVAAAMRRARNLHQIAQEQEQVSDQTESAGPEQAPALAQRQGTVADEIERVEQAGEVGQQGRGGDGPQGQSAAVPGNSRAGALAAIQAAQERLAEMPQQLARTQELSLRRGEFAWRAESAQRDAAGATFEEAPAARRAVEQARRDVGDAVDRLGQAAQQVDAAVARDLAASLAPYQPETGTAVEALDRQLTGALRQLAQSLSARDPAAVETSIVAARQAIDQAQQALRQAQDQVNERDPILAAKWFARQAAQLLSRRPADPQAARQRQQGVSQALQQAQDQSVQQAGAARLAQTDTLGPLFSLRDWTPSGVATGSTPAGAPHQGLSAVFRDWTWLRQRDPAEINAPSREADPPAYQEALKAYFEALNKERVETK